MEIQVKAFPKQITKKNFQVTEFDWSGDGISAQIYLTLPKGTVVEVEEKVATLSKPWGGGMDINIWTPCLDLGDLEKSIAKTINQDAREGHLPVIQMAMMEDHPEVALDNLRGCITDLDDLLGFNLEAACEFKKECRLSRVMDETELCPACPPPGIPHG